MCRRIQDQLQQFIGNCIQLDTHSDRHERRVIKKTQNLVYRKIKRKPFGQRFSQRVTPLVNVSFAVGVARSPFRCLLFSENGLALSLHFTDANCQGSNRGLVRWGVPPPTRPILGVNFEVWSGGGWHPPPDQTPMTDCMISPCVPPRRFILSKLVWGTS